MAIRYIYSGRGDRGNVNGVNANFKFLFDDIQSIKMALMDVVAKDMLTAEQYTEFMVAINDLIKKGEVSVSDININLGKIGLTHLSDEVIQAIAGTANVNATVADGSITTIKVASKAITSDKLSTDAIDRLSQESLFRAMITDNMNTVLYPTSNAPFATYATSVNDKYFSKASLSGTTPSNSFDENKSMTIANGGYFFYTVKLVEKFLETRKVSIMLENSNAETLVQYRFFDSASAQIGGIVNVPLVKTGYYILENITIPSNATTLELRIDNRSVSTSTVIKNVTISPYAFIGIENERVDILESSVSEISNALEEVKKPIIPNGVLVRTPQGFTGVPYQLTNRIYKDAYGKAFTDYDVSENKLNKGTVYYVDYKAGNDLNDGLTKNTPFKSFKKAVEKTDVGEVCLKGGRHFRVNGTSATVIPKSVNITSYEGIAQLILADELDWVKVDGYSNVYSVSRSATGKVVDLSRKLGTGYVEFKQVNSIEEVQSTIDSFYTDGTKVYARYSKQPIKSDLIALIRARHLNVTSQLDYIYMQDVEIIGGRTPYHNESEVSEEYFKNVKFLHSLETNGLETVGGKTIIVQDCVASWNYTDGFNYHIGATGSKPNIAEINCLAEENGAGKGLNGAISNNGSTIHDGLKIIRIGGTYVRNDGGNIADVNTGTQAWNLNVTAGESYQNADFLLSGSEAWFDGCVCYGSKQGLQVGNGSTAHIRNPNFQTELISSDSIKDIY